jgi:hypothetical protein
MQYVYIILQLLQYGEQEFGVVTTWKDEFVKSIRGAIRAARDSGIISKEMLKALLRLNMSASIGGANLLKLIDETWTDAVADFDLEEEPNDYADEQVLSLNVEVRARIAQLREWHRKLMPEARRHLSAYAAQPQIKSNLLSRWLIDDIMFDGWMNVRPNDNLASSFPTLESSYDLAASTTVSDAARVSYLIKGLLIEHAGLSEDETLVAEQGQVVVDDAILREFRVIVNRLEDANNLPLSTPYQILNAFTVFSLKAGYSTMIKATGIYADAMIRRYTRILHSKNLSLTE